MDREVFMHRTWFLVLSLLLTSLAAFGQTSPTESQTLQALLAEVRQLRQDLRTTTATAQRVQILLFRLQLQEAAVARMERRLDDAHSNLAQAQSELKRLASEIKIREDVQSNTQNPVERRELEEVLPKIKAELESLKSSEQQLLARELETEQELRAEGAKLIALQGQLDMLDKSLESSDR
jgi:DNA repair exonuclease SbcCD ATPase subunit